jgi:hypothetical protein
MAKEISGDRVNVSKLRELYAKSAAARAILDHFAKRERDWHATGVDRLQSVVASEGTPISRADVIQVLQELDATGCGNFVVGRRGKKSRFVWHVGMVSVGRLAAGESVPVDPLESAIAPETPDEETESNAIVHKYVLRTTYPVSIELPADLTTTEAGRLAAFIRTLPLNQEPGVA